VNTTRRIRNADYLLAEEVLDECPHVTWWWEGDTLFLSGQTRDVDRASRLVRGF
jgi:hypothetical protein